MDRADVDRCVAEIDAMAQQTLGGASADPAARGSLADKAQEVTTRFLAELGATFRDKSLTLQEAAEAHSALLQELKKNALDQPVDVKWLYQKAIDPLAQWSQSDLLTGASLGKWPR